MFAKTASLNSEFTGFYKKSVVIRVSDPSENRLNQRNGTVTHYSVCRSNIAVELKHKEIKFMKIFVLGTQNFLRYSYSSTFF